MRPRVFPAEDSGHGGGGTPTRIASMRPRVFPAEDAMNLANEIRCAKSFNEAAGIPRGRHDWTCCVVADCDQLQ